MIYRWLEHDEVLGLVNPALRFRGMAELNINDQQPTCRVLGAFNEKEELLEVFVIQLYPVLGPLLRIDNTAPDNGAASRGLAERMHDFLKESGTRGCLAIAESPVTERLCRRFGMERIESPVYGFVKERSN